MRKWTKEHVGDKFFIATFFTLMGSIIAFWFSYTYPQAMNENMGVLLIFAERLVEGKSFKTDIYEVNPPLSILIYAPIIWLKKCLPFDIHQASFLYISLLLTLSISFLHVLLKVARTPKYEHCAIISIYILGHLFITVNDYGEREQFVAMGLIPLCILIHLKTVQTKISYHTSILISGFGIIMILLKPHFGLAPACLFLYRAWKRRSLFSPIKDSDFIIMTAGTTGYIICLLLFFQTYVFEQLPGIMDLYVSQVFVPPHMVLVPLIYSILLGVLCLLYWGSDKITYKPSLVYVWSVATLLCLISFITQTKGMFYHLIPASILFLMSCGMGIFYTLNAYLCAKRSLIITVIIATLIPILTIYPLNFQFPSRNDIKALPFATWFKEFCPLSEQCSAYIFHESVDGIFGSFHYTDTKYASRFPAHWFLPIIRTNLERQKRNLSHYKIPYDTNTQLDNRFTRMVAEDFQRYTPHFVALMQTKISLDPQNENSELIKFDFVDHYSRSGSFQKEWQNYKYVDTRTINRKYYFKGTGMDKDHLITYDLYIRK